MASEQHETATAATAGGQAHAAGSPDILQVSSSMFALTWVAFAIMLVILYKFAWKPILAALDRRDDEIRRAVENAEKLKDELAKIEAQRAKVIAEADRKAKEIVENGRKAAVEAANLVEKKAREEISILQENAEREIKAAHEKAVSSLKREVAGMAVAMAAKVVRENLDPVRQKALADKLIGELRP